MTAPGTYAKRQRKRRMRNRIIDRALTRKYGREAFPGLGPIVWMDRVIHILMKLSKTTGSIGGKPRTNPLIVDDPGPAPDPELCERLFRSFPKEHIIGPLIVPSSLP